MPNKKNRNIIKMRLFLFVIDDPTYSPILEIEVSVPLVNSPIPNTMRTQDTEKAIVSLILNGDRPVKFKSKTITKIGKTDSSESLNFNSHCIVFSQFIVN